VRTFWHSPDRAGLAGLGPGLFVAIWTVPDYLDDFLGTLNPLLIHRFWVQIPRAYHENPRYLNEVGVPEISAFAVYRGRSGTSGCLLVPKFASGHRHNPALVPSRLSPFRRTVSHSGSSPAPTLHLNCMSFSLPFRGSVPAPISSTSLLYQPPTSRDASECSPTSPGTVTRIGRARRRGRLAHSC
jgi:hypothetical protein